MLRAQKIVYLLHGFEHSNAGRLHGVIEFQSSMSLREARRVCNELFHVIVFYRTN